MRRARVLAMVTAGAVILAALPGCAPTGPGEELAWPGVAYRAWGGGMTHVCIELHRAGPGESSISIPAGTYFGCSQRFAQGMVTTRDTMVSVPGDRPITVDVPALCADREKAVPENERFTFRIRRAPWTGLPGLMAAIERGGANSVVSQAAVWIALDNSDYALLGTLISMPNQDRLIRENEAARAMQICEMAGVDITRRAVWRDRYLILQGVTDGSLRSWLTQRGQL